MAAALPMPDAPSPWSDAVSVLTEHHDRARLLCAGGAPVYLLVNPVEYHGPHLSLHNDHLISRGLAGWLHACWAPHLGPDFLVGDDLEIGVDPVPGPGSRPVSAQEVRRRVIQAVDSLVELGARRIVLVTFHGAPLHSLALQAGVERAWSRGVRAFAPMAAMLPGLGDLASLAPVLLPHVREAAARDRVAARLGSDFHGGFVETSLSLATAPESVSPDYTSVPDCPDFGPVVPHQLFARVLGMVGATASAQLVAAGAWGAGWAGLRPHPGYTGVPSQATAAAGRALLGHYLPGLAAEGLAVLQGGRTPRTPPLAWLWAASLGGRLPT